MKTKNSWVIGAVAGMLALSIVSAKADDMTTSSTTDTSMSPMKMTSPIDYSVLNNRSYDYVDLKAAKARGYSDDEVATMVKIAKVSGLRFQTIVQRVQDGETFLHLADAANMRVVDVYDNDTEKKEIANYIAAYQTTGSYAMKDSMAASSMPMSTSPMDTTTSSDTSSTSSTTTTSMAPMADMSMADKDIATIAMNTNGLGTLVKALKAAGLVETLQGPGPFTVFAPTDKAFKNLPKGTLNALLNDPDTLKKVLTYHVLPAKVDAATAMSMTSPTSPPTVEGGTLQVTTGNGGVMINNAKVIKADIIASNGIIHVIDAVLVPTDVTLPMAK